MSSGPNPWLNIMVDQKGSESLDLHAHSQQKVSLQRYPPEVTRRPWCSNEKPDIDPLLKGLSVVPQLSVFLRVFERKL